jgi:sugar-specific transcriptional regulator TrmB
LAWAEVLENLGERQIVVYKALLELKSANNTMISNYLNLPINCITPRINELRKKGLVRKDRIDICPYTKKQTIFWRVFRQL